MNDCVGWVGHSFWLAGQLKEGAGLAGVYRSG